MTQDLLNRYGGSVPRYTSYPTAPHFHADVTSDVYAAWLETLPADETLSIYLHVPFCKRMCWYCGCHTKITKRYNPIADYAKHLALEMELISARIPRRQTVKHIHWGGGTPTILSSGDFMSLMTRLRTQFDFDPKTEIAIEIDPCTLTREMAQTLAAAGVNRVSLGVQDFNTRVQQAINREQTFEQTQTVVHWLRDCGIEKINLDLMYGLPKQTVADTQRTAALSMNLQADRYSVFGYAHVPWMKTHQKKIKDQDLPDSSERLQQAQAIASVLEQNGYTSIGLDHFAKPEDPMALAQGSGDLHRNFQGYTTDNATSLIGLGASAIGRMPSGYVQNTSSERQYKEAITQGTFPIARGIALSANDNLRREIIERLMCDLSVDLEKLCQQSNVPLKQFDSEMKTIGQMQTDGVVEFADGKIRITQTGQPFVRSVCAVFDEFLQTGKGRHSQAV